MKIKNWLIKKLGGYVEPPIRQVKIERVVMEPVTLNVCVSGDYPLFKDRMEQEACKELAKLLFEHEEVLRMTVDKDPYRIHEDLHVTLRALRFMEEPSDE